jgi:hypothetical protein
MGDKEAKVIYQEKIKVLKLGQQGGADGVEGGGGGADYQKFG